MISENPSDKPPFGYTEDLISELEYKLEDLTSHIKFLSNSTSGWGNDFDFSAKDINAMSQTLYDKAGSALFVVEKLKASLNHLNV